ncbi:hypothetical protein BKA70DRAFT_1219148 [Coprinopsis sp. MPI-PUGE-AT-0042]|nr:hypothetical protein BKA70DRAFT_1219148 [Coprinopsis sp. MPI-PUGE-AT-0042]
MPKDTSQNTSTPLRQARAQRQLRVEGFDMVKASLTTRMRVTHRDQAASSDPTPNSGHSRQSEQRSKVGHTVPTTPETAAARRGSCLDANAQAQAARAEAERQELVAIIARLKRQVESRKSAIKQLKTEIDDAKQECAEYRKELEEKDEELEEKDEELTRVRKEEIQYRNWWLNEIQFMKLLLNKIPDPNRDIELVRASQAHYLGHY